MSAHTIEEQIMDVKYKCDDYGEPFFSLGALKSHCAVHSVDDNSLNKIPGNFLKDIVYECNKCEAAFYSVVSLQCHKMVHSIEEDSSSIHNSDSPPPPNDSKFILPGI